MATVNKNFKIKNGLVVEGSTATVNGQNILTETGGDSYILNLVGGAALVKSVSSDFTVTGGGELQVNNSSDLARTGDITSAINALDTDAIEEGGSNLYFTQSRARDAFSAGAGIAAITNGVIELNLSTGLEFRDGTSGAVRIDRDQTDTWYDASGAASSAQTAAESYTDTKLSDYTKTADLDTTVDGYGYLKSADLSGYATESYVNTAIGNIDLTYTTDDVTEGSNLYFTSQRALDATASAYDAYGAASSAEGAANTYTDNAINALDTDDIEEGANNLYFTENRAQQAIVGVNGILGSGLQYSGGQLSVDTSTIATQTYVNNAIDNLIDGAPGLLDTLNEIAAAINDDANYFTTVANAIAAKQDTLTAGSNISIVSNTISVTGLDTDDVSEGSNLYFTDARARDAVDGTNRSFTSVAINEVAKQVAATTNVATAATVSVYSFLPSAYKSGEFLVKTENGTHTEISKILLTIDTSNNIHITEYGTVGTNGNLATISAGTIQAGGMAPIEIALNVTTLNNNSKVTVYGTLLK